MTCHRATLVLTCLRAGLVSEPDLSLGRTCLRAGLVSGPDLFSAGLVSSSRARDVQGWLCLAAGSVQIFRAGNVLPPVLARSRESLGAIIFTYLPEVNTVLAPL